jgi:hypothetical protein
MKSKGAFVSVVFVSVGSPNGCELTLGLENDG